MQRRKFLGLLGAAVTAPLAPSGVLASAAKKAVTYSPASVHAAIYHAQTRAVFSTWGLARAANLSVDQATALMNHLADRGVLGPLQGTTHGGRWAKSNVLQSDMLAKAKAMRASRAATSPHKTNRPFEADLSHLIAHLRGLCVQNGMTLHPRCAA